MQSSAELPEDYGVAMLLSPEASGKENRFRNSQQSLAYSTSMAKNKYIPTDLIEQAYDQFNFDDPNCNAFSIQATAFSKTSPIKGRATVTKGESRRLQELEAALELEAVKGEELRVKNAVLVQLVQKGLEAAGEPLCNILKLKNSSRQGRNVDIFVEMKLIQKNLHEKEVYCERVKTENTSLKQENEKLKKAVQERKDAQHKIMEGQKEDKPGEFGRRHSPEKNILKEVCTLREEKESLCNYIEEQKEVVREAMGRAAALEEEIELLRQKQEQYVQERAKLVGQFGEKQRKCKEIEDELQRCKMEYNLEVMAQVEEISNLQHSIQMSLRAKEGVNVAVNTEALMMEHLTYSTAANTDPDELPFLREELGLLQRERDYFREEESKKKAAWGQLQALKIKLRWLE